MARREPMKKGDSRRYDIESTLASLNNRIEFLKTQYNLYFTGELKSPPEPERITVENTIRNLQANTPKSPRAKLLLENISATFMTYNSMWKKRMFELETGIVKRVVKKPIVMEDQPKKPPQPGRQETLDVSLNREDSFENFYRRYARLTNIKDDDPRKEMLINKLKTKLITSNLIDARVTLQVDKGKMKLKIQK